MGECSQAAPRSLVCYSAGALAVGAMLALWSLYWNPVRLSADLLLLGGAAVLSENFALRLGSYSVSLTFPVIVAAMVVDGPAAACLVAAVSSTNLADLCARRPLSYSVFNLGQVLIAGGTGGWSYLLAGGPVLTVQGVVEPASGSAVPHMILAVLVAGATYSVLNALLTGIAVHLAKGVPLTVVYGSFIEYVPTQISLACVGLLLAQVTAVSPWALPLFLFPLLLARQVYQRYAAMRDVYLDTVRSLIGALEAKDPYTRGHSERVAGYAVELGRAIGLDEASLDTLEKSALLHDIGKLALSSDVLSKPSSLSEQEVTAMKRHPENGASIVGRIPPLRGLESMVLCHHERFDGKGYPCGLADTAIPVLSRVLSVADAYDAMTTNRAYREAMTSENAAAELSRGSGNQFDPVLVQAFLRSVLSRRDAEAPIVTQRETSLQGAMTQ